MNKICLLSFIILGIMLLFTSSCLAFNVTDINDTAITSINISLPHNSSVTYTFKVNGVPTENISVDSNIFLPHSFSVTATGTPNLTRVDLNLTIPLYWPSSLSQNSIFILDTNTNESVGLPINITVIETSNLTVLNTTNCTTICNTTINNYTASIKNTLPTSMGYFLINISNLGNSNEILMNETLFNISSNSSLITPAILSTGINTPPGSIISLPMTYNFTRFLGEFVEGVQLNFTSSMNTTTLLNFTLDFNTTDNSPPVIDMVSYNNTTTAGMNFNMNVSAHDNINISMVRIDIGNSTYYINNTTNGAYYLLTNFTTDGIKNVSISVNDTSNNMAWWYGNLTVYKLGGVTIFPIQNAAIKAGEFMRYKILTIDNPVDFNVILQNVSCYPPLLPNQTIQYYIVTGPSLCPVSENQSCIIKNYTGEVYFKLSSDYMCNDNGDISFTFPNYTEAGNTSTHFSITFGQYTILPEKQVYIGSQELDCKFQDTGFMENSSYICQINYGTNVDLNSLGIYMTQAQYDSLNQVLNSKLDVVQGNIGGIELQRNLLIVTVAIFVVIGFVYYLLEVRGLKLKLV